MEELKLDGYLFEYKKLGVRIVVLFNEDDNKVFSIGFRIFLSDNMGVFYILEYFVLCGFKKFLVKDLFVELLKGLLNIFLNVMMYLDKMIYLIVSCNDYDFYNLMDIYLDVVLNINIYENEKIFL